MLALEGLTYITPRPMRMHSMSLVRRFIWTSRRMMIGKVAQIRSVIMEKTMASSACCQS